MSDELARLEVRTDRHGPYWAVYRGEQMLAYCDNNSRAQAIADALNAPPPPADVRGLVSALEYICNVCAEPSLDRVERAQGRTIAALTAYRSSQPAADSGDVSKLQVYINSANKCLTKGDVAGAVSWLILAVTELNPQVEA